MTRFLVTGRQAGKTTAAVQWVNEAPGRRLVVPFEEERRRVLREYFPRAEGEESWLSPFVSPGASPVVTYSYLASGHLRGQRDIDEVAVDNLDLMLHQIFWHQVGLVTATGESQRQDGALLRWE